MADGLSGDAWYCVRQDGRAIRSGWVPAVSIADLRRHVQCRTNEVIEICLVERVQDVAPRHFSKVFSNRARGLSGIELSFQGEFFRIAPTRMIAANLSFERALEQFLAQGKISLRTFVAGGALRAFSTKQFLLQGDGWSREVQLYRGSTPVFLTEADSRSLATELAEGIGDWMIGNLSADGSIPYKYWPSRGQVSPADNAIRNFLVPWSLARWGSLKGSQVFKDAARRSLRFNLSRYFRQIGDGRGAIVESTGAKLGAAAVAGLAILANSNHREFRDELSMLCSGVNSLLDSKYGFRTFFFPQERDGENWNFYSGEALLFWVEALRHGLPTARSLETCTATFERCRARHYRRRNPAFVPWHTQACASLYSLTGHQEFADFAFEINDWLLPMQQWDGLPPDMKGRFYDPLRPEFGPPHAASTGAYLEGLALATDLARKTGNQTRISAYELAVSRGLRSLRQLQFRNSSDAFYISRKRRVIGALRTEVYDNAIRADSAAHALLAATSILQSPGDSAPHETHASPAVP